MKPTSKIIASLAALFMAGGLLAACEEQGPAERAGEQIDETAEEMGERMEETGEDIQNALPDYE